MRTFETGATRDDDANKIDYDGFISPYALKAFGEYMHRHRVQADGSLRDSDNWQKGIPMDAYRKSLWRHFHEAWTMLREGDSGPATIEALCAMQFNVQGLLHELTKPGSPTEDDGLKADTTNSDPGVDTPIGKLRVGDKLKWVKEYAHMHNEYGVQRITRFVGGFVYYVNDSDGEAECMSGICGLAEEFIRA